MRQEQEQGQKAAAAAAVPIGEAEAEALRAEGFGEPDVAELAGYGAERVRRAIANADALAARGELGSRCGYIASAIRRGFAPVEPPATAPVADGRPAEPGPWRDATSASVAAQIEAEARSVEQAWQALSDDERAEGVRRVRSRVRSARLLADDSARMRELVVDELAGTLELGGAA